MSDDITFCANDKCKNYECFRNPINIRCPLIPHSFAVLEGTDLCMNNKKLGSLFEQEACEILKSKGWWVHFMSPDRIGAQPFDIIAIKDNNALAIDCKTAVKRMFNISRLENNQVLAFDRWTRCGNPIPQIMVKYGEHIKMIPYDVLREKGKVDLDEIPDFQ